MLSSQEEQQERLETLENDRKVLEAEQRRILREGTTFHQFAQSAANDEAGGRFASINPTTVVGAGSAPKYPQLPSGPWSGSDPVPDEPPLGYALEPSATPVSVEATGEEVSAPAERYESGPSGSSLSERASSPLSSTEGSDNDAA